VLGLKVNFVLDTFAAWLPLAVVTHSGYIVAFVVVSSVIATFVAFVAVVAVVAVLAAMAVLQPKPVFVVQLSALDDVLHEPMASAVGDAVPLVALPTMVFVACVAKPESGKPLAFVSVPEEGVPSAPPEYRIVAFASGSVNVFSAVVGPLNFVKPLPVPPFALGSIPDTSAPEVSATLAHVAAPTFDRLRGN